jgi:starch synthase (maltosyl-transferring)
MPLAAAARRHAGLPDPAASGYGHGGAASAGSETMNQRVAQLIPIGVPDGRVRAVVEAVTPAVDGGRFAVKRIVGDSVVVEADCHADGHDELGCAVLYRHASDAEWRVAPMQPLGNDRWRASFVADRIGAWRYTISAWVDAFRSWRHDFARRTDEADLRVAARSGAALIAGAAQRARDSGDRQSLERWAHELLQAAAGEIDAMRRVALDAARAEAAQRWPDLQHAWTHPVEFPLVADRVRAQFSTWYEFFPRSASPEPGRHGTLRDCVAMLPYVARMGFDVVYLPPVHPIGRERRKGRNNALAAEPGDVGSPWAIGAAEGGHKALHPELGTFADFRDFVAAAARHGIEVALDIALQCAPDHPYVTEHPQWFRKRADGSIQYAENPPKKYQDIYPFDFETADWRAMWDELASVIEFWIGHGVRIFRVDNPHTKSFAFWEWAIARVHAQHPDTIFLAEAFTRPKVMHRLAKLGFTQSYTYFTWRNTRHELTEYFTELAHGPGRDYFRPNAWPNTPDILPEVLQVGGRGAFMARVVLAATLSANYGLYGPAYELLEHLPREPGSEEYLHSEKYQLRHWDLARPDSLAGFIAVLNIARRENAALQSNASLRFLPIDNERMIAYAKSTPALDNIVVTVVNLNPHHGESGWVEMDLKALGLPADEPYEMHDVLGDQRFLWNGARNWVSLDPQRSPAHVMVVRRRLRREHDFDYFH